MPTRFFPSHLKSSLISTMDDANSNCPATEPILRASRRLVLRTEAAGRWKDEWKGGTHGATTRRIFPEPSRRLLGLHYGLRRAASSVLVQMQTGKIALAGYLGRFGAMESTECPCGLGRQDIRHILLDCPRHSQVRSRVLRRGPLLQLDHRAYLTDPELIPKAIQFMLETRLLGQFGALPASYRVSTTHDA